MPSTVGITLVNFSIYRCAICGRAARISCFRLRANIMCGFRFSAGLSGFICCIGSSDSGRLLCFFFGDWKRKSAFRPAKKNHHIVIRCATLSWSCDFGNLSWGDQQENLNRTATRIWTPRHEEECSAVCWAIKRNAAPLGELFKASRWSSRELSLSQGALALKEHELLAAVVVKSAKKHVLIVSSDSSPRGHEFVLPV